MQGATGGFLVRVHPQMAIFADFVVGRKYLISGWTLDPKYAAGLSG